MFCDKEVWNWTTFPNKIWINSKLQILDDSEQRILVKIIWSAQTQLPILRITEKFKANTFLQQTTVDFW